MVHKGAADPALLVANLSQGLDTTSLDVEPRHASTMSRWPFAGVAADVAVGVDVVGVADVVDAVDVVDVAASQS